MLPSGRRCNRICTNVCALLRNAPQLVQHLSAGVPAEPGGSVAMLPTKACKTAADALLARQVCANYTCHPEV